MTNPRRPSLLVRWIIEITAHEEDRDALLGDIYEEFAERCQRAPAAANVWVWGQVVRSASALLIRRLQTNDGQQIARTIVAILTALIFMWVWDVFLARAAARAFVEVTNATSYGPARIFYFSVKAIGFALVGAFIARITFRKGRTFLENASGRLLPACLVLFAPPLLQLIFADSDYPSHVALLSLGLAGPAIAAGAAAYYWRQGLG